MASSISQKKAEYTLSYSAMKGVDLSADNSGDRTRYAYLENMYRDYDGESNAPIESIPGFRKLVELRKEIHKIYIQKISENEEYVIIHSGNSIYRFDIASIDELKSPTPIATLQDGESCGFTCGSVLYIMDGVNMIKINPDGSSETVSSQGDLPYVPTTFVNGEEYEQRNLLTDRFREKYFISSTDKITYGSEELYYRIIDPINKLAAVIGINEEFSGELHIPSYVAIGIDNYRVSEISDSAFAHNNSVTAVRIGEGVVRIGKNAFAYCENIAGVRCPSTLEEIENCAFIGCKKMVRIFLGSGMIRLGNDIFSGCTALSEIHYTADEESFKTIENSSVADTYTVIYASMQTALTVKIPLNTPTIEISSLKVGGVETDFFTSTDGENITAVVFSDANGRILEGKEVVIEGVAHPKMFSKSSAGTVILSNSDYTGTGEEAILGCRICESFDGRIFLSGNPRLPNTVFYSSRDESGNNNPLYFGVLNYFNDGIGTYPVNSMLAAGDSLAVFKSGDDGGGSIFYHVPTETGINILPKIYPVSYVHSGIGAIGDSISFFDDPVFISQNGISALDKKAINLQRSVACRSHNVNASLLCEDLRKAVLTKWQGYLVVLTRGNIYLADSRATFTHETGYREYEWYFLSGIGTRRSAKRVYRFGSVAPEGFEIYEEMLEERVDGVVFGEMVGDEEFFFYHKDGKKYIVYATEEYIDGILSPAVAATGTDGGLLFFGTENGDLCVFNNDKRGVPPPYIKDAQDFDAEEYAAIYGRRIHPYYYSFEKNAVRYAVKTIKDDCSIPHLSKSTVKHSLTVKCRMGGSGKVICEVGTDRGGYTEVTNFPGSSNSFSDFNFSTVSLTTEDTATLPLCEKEKNWIEKQIAIYTDAFRAPFAIYSITYRFTIKGKIKKN